MDPTGHGCKNCLLPIQTKLVQSIFVVCCSYSLDIKSTLNATANATLFKVLFLGNGLRYPFEILDLKFGEFSYSEMVISFICDDRLPMHVSHVQLFYFACGNTHN